MELKAKTRMLAHQQVGKEDKDADTLAILY